MSESILLTFDTSDASLPEAVANLSWSDIWPRQFFAGGSEGHLGATTVALITKPFTPGEDAVIAWAASQDLCTLIGCYHMADGRDFMLLQRHHTKQTYEDAVLEHRRHLARKLIELGVITVEVNVR